MLDNGEDGGERTEIRREFSILVAEKILAVKLPGGEDLISAKFQLCMNYSNNVL